MIVTALLPHIGYEKATLLVEEFSRSGGESILDFLSRKLGPELAADVFSPELVALGYKDTVGPPEGTPQPGSSTRTDTHDTARQNLFAFTSAFSAAPTSGSPAS